MRAPSWPTWGSPQVYSFHMVPSFSLIRFAASPPRGSGDVLACHRRRSTFGGVPGSIVYDRTKTVVRRHVAPGQAVPLHPEAVAFAGHYGFDIDVLAAYRPTGKGRVERQVMIVRDHVLAGRSFASLGELDEAFLAWLPACRRTVHRTHGEVIGALAQRDHAALGRSRPGRMWWRTGICATSARTAWSRSRPTCISPGGPAVPSAAGRGPRQRRHHQRARHRARRERRHAAGRAPAGGRPRRRIVDPEHWEPLPDRQTGHDHQR